MLSSSLNTEELEQKYSADQRIRIPDVLQPELAQQLQGLYYSLIPFEQLMSVQGQNRAFTASEMAAMSDTAKRQLQEQLVRQAGEGVGFLYGGYRLTD